MTTDEPSTPRQPVVAPPHVRRRNLLLIMAGFIAMLGIIAGSTFIYFYDRATAIDRSTPEAAALQFLDAAFVKKDSTRTSLFVCEDWSATAAMSSASVPVGDNVSASWEDADAVSAGSSATVTVRAVFRIPVGNGFQQYAEQWALQLRDEDGWRVCSLKVTPSLNA